ncbi:hypothetical protein, partial [Escherichia coli]|uniref:hypothetical protein n=1 Tax=Escherichia coli TaxID=562 RepID=UPI001BE408E7
KRIVNENNSAWILVLACNRKNALRRPCLLVANWYYITWFFIKMADNIERPCARADSFTEQI